MILVFIPGCSPEYFRLVYEGVHKAEEGAYGEAVFYYTRAMYAGAPNAFIYLHRAEAWAALGSYENALQDYDSALARDKDNDGAYIGRGAVRLNLYESLWDADTVLREGGRGVVAAERSALHRLVIADLDRALLISPRSVDAFKMRAHAHLVFGEIKEAIVDLEAVEWLTWPDVWVLSTRARARVLAGDLSAALTDFTAAIRISPDDSELRCERGLVAYDMGAWGMADEDFTRAIRQQPSSPWPWYFRALARRKMGRSRDAFDDACRAAAAGCFPASALAAVIACDFR